MTNNYKKYSPNMLSIIILLIVTFLISLTLNSNPFSNSLPKHDSSMFTYFGYAMNEGQVMYKDIFDHKGPLIFFINFLGEKLTFGDFSGIYIIEIISVFFFLYYSFKTARIWLSSKLSFLPVAIVSIILMTFLEGGNLTEEFALPFISYSIYVFIKFYMKDQKVKLYEIFAIGLSFGSVLLLRPNMVSVWFVFCLIILLDLFFKKKYSLLAKIVVWFVAGALTVFLPFVLYLNYFGALSDGIFQAFTFNFMYLGDSNSKEQGILDLLKLISANYILLFLIAIILVNIYNWNKLQDNEKKVFIGVTCTVFLSFLLSVMSGRAYPHYLMVVIPSIIVPMVWLLNYFSNKIVEKKLIIMALVFIPFIFMTQIYDAYNYAYEINIITTPNNKDTEKFNIRETKSLNNQHSFQKLTEVANVIKQNSGIKDRIYTHRIGGNLYLLSDRLASIKYFNLPAVNINEDNVIGNDFLIDIKNSESKLIVLETTFKDKEKYKIEKEFFDWVSNQYKVIYEKNNYTVYLKK